MFVKLRQAAGTARRHALVSTDQIDWRKTGVAGVERKMLAAHPGFSDATFLERWGAETEFGDREFKGGVEYFVLEGGFSDEAGTYREGSWLRLPAGSRHRPVTRDGCLLYVKVDALRSLRSSQESGE